MKRLLFAGIRGIPANYSGFETFVQEVAVRLAKMGWNTAVFCRPHFYKIKQRYYRGVRLIYLSSIKSKSLETLSHTFMTFLYLLFNPVKTKWIYFCGVGNAPLLPLFRMLGYKTLINVDGKDWEREKWGRFARWYLRISEKLSVWFSSIIIADSTTIYKRYKNDYNAENIVYVPYGANIRERKRYSDTLERYGLEKNKYILFVSRLEPENRAHLLIESYKMIKTDMPLVIVGDAPYATDYKRRLKEMSSGYNILFTGYLTGNDYLDISANAYLFALPSHIDGTRPVLLDQMAMGNGVVVSDIPVNREVTGGCAFFFNKDDPQSLKNAVEDALLNPDKIMKFQKCLIDRIKNIYNWERIVSIYEDILRRSL